MSRYKDIKITLAPHPLTKDLVISTDADAIKRSVKNILLTGKGERFFDNLNFGAGLQKYLFENATPAHEYLISEEIKRSLRNFEPRILVQKVTVKVSPDENAYNAEVVYKIRNTSELQELRVILSRVR